MANIENKKGYSAKKKNIFKEDWQLSIKISIEVFKDISSTYIIFIILYANSKKIGHKPLQNRLFLLSYLLSFSGFEPATTRLRQSWSNENFQTLFHLLHILAKVF